ncbi:hypothetical protein BDR26DRAFT_898601 [Obelidium mucronatum]|nr:hypothetical protein BDR26DRAFT_898601 [Obelidium mucronatum]
MTEILCSICLMQMQTAEEVARVDAACRHVFHLACLSRWALVTASCPLDRLAFAQAHVGTSAGADPFTVRRVVGFAAPAAADFGDSDDDGADACGVGVHLASYQSIPIIMVASTAANTSIDNLKMQECH